MRQRYEAKFIFGATGFVFGVIVLALGFAPMVRAQGQAANQSHSVSSPQNATAAQTSSQATGAAKSESASPSQAAASPATKTTSSSGAEPKMQSQEAPPAETLGEAARRAKVQKNAAPAAKVYTEDKIAGLSGHGVSVVGDANQGGEYSASADNSSPAPTTTGGAPAGKTEEQMWRDRARKIHDQMDQIDAQVSKIQDEIQKYGAVSFDPTTGLQRNVIYIEDRNAQIKQLQAQKDRLAAQLDSLEEEGRKAGADSGWFR